MMRMGKPEGGYRSFIGLFLLLLLLAFPLARSSPLAEGLPASRSPVAFPEPAIGCVLPLSGRDEIVGRRALRGVIAASDPFSPSSGVKVVVVDFGEGSRGVRQAFARMAGRGDVSVVIGPILGSSVERALGAIERLGVPTIVFPLSEEDFPGNPYLIRFGYPLESQARVLARFAVVELGVDNFAVIFPDTRPGRILRDSFVRSVELFRGRVGYVSTYGEFMEGFDTELAWLRAAKPGAIFIPHGAMRSAELVGRLRQAEGFERVVFLGPSTWNSPTLLKVASGEEGGLYFTDFFFPQSRRWVEFRERFRQAFGEEPGFLEYQVYEAATLAKAALRGGSAGSPDGFIERLSERGSTPFYELRKNQGGGITVAPRPYLLKVERGRVVRVRFGAQ